MAADNSGFVQAARPLNANASQPDTKPPSIMCYFMVSPTLYFSGKS